MTSYIRVNKNFAMCVIFWAIVFFSTVIVALVEFIIHNHCYCDLQTLKLATPPFRSETSNQVHIDSSTGLKNEKDNTSSSAVRAPVVVEHLPVSDKLPPPMPLPEHAPPGAFPLPMDQDIYEEFSQHREEVDQASQFAIAEWETRIQSKLLCRSSGYPMGYYLYHARKAAGTTLREVLRLSSRRNGWTIYETEGITLSAKILPLPNLISSITLRHPVDRIMSLYWYEHVTWHVAITQKPDKAKPLTVWVNAWKDSSPTKQALLQRFPTNNYVEVENYYVKLLVGWKATDRPVDRAHLQLAKEQLTKFDLVLLQEWLAPQDTHYAGQVELMDQLVPLVPQPRGRNPPHLLRPRPPQLQQLRPETINTFQIKQLINQKKVVSNDTLHSSYPLLMAQLLQDKVQVREELMALNALDLELFQFAQQLVEARIAALHRPAAPPEPPAPADGKEGASSAPPMAGACMRLGIRGHSRMSPAMFTDLLPSVGLFQPPGHKGP